MSEHGEPNCTCCVPLETLCFVFGVISCVLSFFGIAFLSIALILGDPVHRGDFFWDDQTIENFTLKMLLYIYCISSFIFSAMLSYGAYVRRSSFLKAYLMYGFMVLALTTVGSTVYFSYSWVLDSVSFSIVFATCWIYSLPLLMVQRTYTQFRKEKTLYIVKLSEYFKR